MRIQGSTVLAAVLSALLASCGTDAPQGCDRDCRIALTDTYLAAVVAGDPTKAPLADDISFVENVTKMEPGQGLWATAVSGPEDFAVYVPDVTQQQAGFMGMMTSQGEDGEQNVLVAVRLKVEGGEIAEAEHIVAAVAANNMQRMATPRPGLVSEVPAASRKSHDELVRIGLSYYDALDDNDGTLMPFADDCVRHENGMITAGPSAGSGPGADPNRAPVANLCGPQLSSKSFTYIDRIENRRLIAADPVTGLSMGFSHFRHPMTNLPYNVIHTDGSTSERNSENFSFNPFDMPAAHIFKIGADGLVHEIEAVGIVTPYNSPTGWE